MKPPLLIALPGNGAITASLARAMGAEVHEPDIRRFPDGETYFRLDLDLHGRFVGLVCTLDRPNAKLLPLLFAARTIHELGAGSVGLIAPYLAYMRQDRRFHAGEAVTANLFASLLSPHFDWLVTVDPHLHRIHTLGAIYDIPNKAVHAGSLIGGWIAAHVPDPLLVGPDSESVQWVGEAARLAQAPVVTLRKTRLDDANVVMEKLDFSRWRGRTPVLVDDIISTGHSMLEAMRMLDEAGMAKAVCIGVHGIFARGAFVALSQGAAKIVTANTVRHPSNAIDVTPLLAAAIAEVLP
jgi:ribose-phosphate pyrophosphokinase